MEKTFLVGNGINRINDCKSWQQLLDELVSYVRKQGAFSTVGKPFPLLYEEILLRAMKYKKKSENDIKKYVCEKLKNLESNYFHQELLNLDSENIITTNYDYNIERSISENDKADKIECCSTNCHRRERDYRMHTYNIVKDKKIWHIHGEINFQNTLVLGHEKYSMVLQKMIKYVNENDVLNKNVDSWIDLFFNTNIHIIGLSLEYTEIDLWWLLNYRARLMQIEKRKKEKRIKNSITYYIPSFEFDKDNIRKKCEILFAHQIKVEQIESNNYDDFYTEFISKIKTTKLKNEVSA